MFSALANHVNSNGFTNFSGTISAWSYYDDPFGSSAIVYVGTQGDIFGGGYQTITENLSSQYYYFRPTLQLGNYCWVRASITSGSTNIVLDSLNTWLSLSSTRNWQLNNSTPYSTETTNLLIEISTSTTGTPVVASGTIILSAAMLDPS